jgi:hypothetical protein
MPEVAARWRIVHGRGPTTTAMTQRDEQEAWEAAIVSSGLPLATDGRGRPRTGFAAPLPLGFEALAERLDCYLTARVRAVEVRAALSSVAPSDHPIAETYDVWLGAPALAAAVIALEYRVLVSPSPGHRRLVEGAATLLRASRLDRRRAKGGTAKSYDLRPLVLDVQALDDATLRVRLRADPALGVGRPDEVVAALGDGLGVPLAVSGGVRERIWLADELERTGPRD